MIVVRTIAAAAATKCPFVVINVFDPGLCYTDITGSAREGRKGS